MPMPYRGQITELIPLRTKGCSIDLRMLTSWPEESHWWCAPIRSSPALEEEANVSSNVDLILKVEEGLIGFLSIQQKAEDAGSTESPMRLVPMFAYLRVVLCFLQVPHTLSITQSKWFWRDQANPPMVTSRVRLPLALSCLLARSHPSTYALQLAFADLVMKNQLS